MNRLCKYVNCCSHKINMLMAESCQHKFTIVAKMPTVTNSYHASKTKHLILSCTNRLMHDLKVCWLNTHPPVLH